MNILEKIKEKRLYFDGGTGTCLQACGLLPGEKPERWNLTRPDEITALHRAYLEAGCNILKTNTFGVNAERFPDDFREIIRAGITCAKKAAADFSEAFVAFDMGPTGRMLEPYGDLAFEDCVALYAENVKEAVRCGVDLILIETMNDAAETKASVLAAKENSGLPVFVTNVYDESGKLLTGADPETMIAMLEGLGVDALGMNCSLGPDKMLEIIDRFTAHASVPIITNPNAGLPQTDGTRTFYDLSAADFAERMYRLAEKGVTVLGGCCGTTPEYLKETILRTQALPYALPTQKHAVTVTSGTRSVVLGGAPVLIGERINPTGKARFKEALRNRDFDYILNEGLRQADAGVQILDVNVGLPELDEPAFMEETVRKLQAVTDLPLQLDSTDPATLEHAMRVYIGKPLINSVNAKEESLRAILPLVRKYGGVLIALTLDENGIPADSDTRFRLALKIRDEAARQSIPAENVVVDPLAMTISADASGAEVTLDTIVKLHEAGFLTSLGVSNISFGLPKRELINAAFFAEALGKGLNCAILNPFSLPMMDTYFAYCALHRHDAACANYIAYAQSRQDVLPTAAASATAQQPSSGNATLKSQDELADAILHGFREKAAQCAKIRLGGTEPLALIQEAVIPALNEVGDAFEAKRIFLPQLLLSAEAATAAFDVIREAMKGSAAKSDNGTVILATVKGDVHDIGKNIVKVLLESYGFRVLDLGRDVPPARVVEAVRESGCCLVGLSALMTTTVPAMAETIRLLRESDLPTVHVIVGGAVLNQSYADRIGADFYAHDAMETVRYAEKYYKR